jgi:hypothetical protein
MTDNTIDFTCALVERYLAASNLDPGGVEILEAGLRTGREKDLKPPDPWQQPLTYYPGLTSKPWHDPATFDWVPRIEEAFPQIRAEALALLESGQFEGSPANANLAEGTWTEVRLYSEGHTFTGNRAAAPRTAELIASIPGATTAGLTFFAHVGPGTHVARHWGPHNARLRCHFGLVVPPGCSMRVGSETRTWEEGKLMVMDDSFDHEVWNNSTESRLVLVFDVWHPDLTPSQIAAIGFASMPYVKMACEVAEAWQRDGSVPRLGRETVEMPA